MCSDRGCLRCDRNIRVEQWEAAFIATIDDVEEQHAIALGAVSRPQDVDVGDVFDYAVSITRAVFHVLINIRTPRNARIMRLGKSSGRPSVLRQTSRK